MEKQLTALERAEIIIKEYEELRAAQKHYFKSRSPLSLNNAKYLESRVDRLVKRYWELKADDRQPKLF